MPGWRVMHLLYLGGALGGAIVSLYQNGGCDEPRNYEFATIQRIMIVGKGQNMRCFSILSGNLASGGVLGLILF